MGKMSISCRNNGYKWSINHNNRTFKNDNVDESRSHLNAYMVQNDIKVVYKELFDDAVTRYNSSQKRKDRHIENYYDKIKQDKKTHVAQEVIFQVGALEDMNVLDDNWETASEVLQEFVKDFQKRNPNLKVFNCVLHMDESVPHLHINYIPFYHAKSGLDTRVGMKQALIEMGFNEKEPFQEWRDREVSLLENLLTERNIERKLVGTHKYLDIPEFKEMKKELSKITEQVNALKSEASELRESIVFESELNLTKNNKGQYNLVDVEGLMITSQKLFNQNSKYELESKELTIGLEQMSNKLNEVSKNYEKARIENKHLKAANVDLNEKLELANAEIYIRDEFIDVIDIRHNDLGLKDYFIAFREKMHQIRESLVSDEVFNLSGVVSKITHNIKTRLDLKRLVGSKCDELNLDRHEQRQKSNDLYR